MTEINGHTYSKKEYKDYKFRYKFEYANLDNLYTSDFDIYTDNSNRNEVFETIFKSLTRMVVGFTIVNVSTKEQDDRSILFLEETLKGI